MFYYLAVLILLIFCTVELVYAFKNRKNKALHAILIISILILVFISTYLVRDIPFLLHGASSETVRFERVVGVTFPMILMYEDNSGNKRTLFAVGLYAPTRWWISDGHYEVEYLPNSRVLLSIRFIGEYPPYTRASILGIQRVGQEAMSVRLIGLVLAFWLIRKIASESFFRRFSS